MRRRLLTPLLTLCLSLSMAQGNKPFFLNYREKDGLPNGTVNRTLVDARGFLWIGTNEGLSRFDGHHFRNYIHDDRDTFSLAGDKITELLEHAPDTLFLLSNGNPMALNTRTHRAVMLMSMKAGSPFHAMAAAENGLTVLSRNDVSYWIAGDRRVIDSVSSPAECQRWPHRLWWLGGTRYFMSCAKWSYFYDRTTRVLSPLRTNPEQTWSIEGLTLQWRDQRNKQSWFTNFYGGLYLISDEGNILDHFPVGEGDHQVWSGNLSFAIPMADGTLWVGMHERGIQVFNKSGHMIRAIVHDESDGNSLAGSSAITFNMDKRNNIWIGTNNGVSRLPTHADAISNWDALQHGLPRETIFTSMQPGSDGSVYVSAYNSFGLYRLDPNGKITLVNVPGKLPIWAFSRVNRHFAITGPGRAVRFFDPGERGHLPALDLQHQMPNTEVITMSFQQRDGTSWYSGNRDGGLVRVAKDGSTVHYRTKWNGGPLPIGYYQMAAEDRQGDLYLGNIRSSALTRWDHVSDGFTELELYDAGKDGRNYFGGVADLVSDTDGDIWVAYEGDGIVRYRPGKGVLRHYRVQDGLPTNYIYHLQFDGQGRLWAASQKGLSCLDDRTGRFIHFNSDNGLPNDVFEQNCSFFDSSSGRLWFGSSHNLLNFCPDTLLSDINEPCKVHIDEMIVNGERATFDGKPLQLSPKENNIGFQFVAPSLNDQSDIEYSYRLQGAGKDWSPPTTLATATYANLRPGRYTFEVRCRHTGAKDWSVVDVPVNFTVAAPWYMTIWARIGFLLALAGLIWGVSRVYYQRKADKERAELEKQQAIERERTRIATDMHDDFGASLSRIKFLSEKSLLDAEDKHILQEDLAKITRYSTEMSEKMGEVVWALNNRYDSLGDLVSFCRAFAAEYLEDKEIALGFDAQGPMDMPISGELRRNLFLVVKEAIHNTAKHSGARNVTVKFTMNGLLKLEVDDDGRGFKPHEVRPFANGLQNMSRRVEQIGGKITMDGSDGFHLTITVDPGHPTNVP